KDPPSAKRSRSCIADSSIWSPGHDHDCCELGFHPEHCMPEAPYRDGRNDRSTFLQRVVHAASLCGVYSIVRSQLTGEPFRVVTDYRLVPFHTAAGHCWQRETACNRMSDTKHPDLE
ncbi:hypothetical protein T310_8050, partial [Rasamsonia emersonii CBS 393.64]